jgi:hypothetical protein
MKILFKSIRSIFEQIKIINIEIVNKTKSILIINNNDNITNKNIIGGLDNLNLLEMEYDEEKSPLEMSMATADYHKFDDSDIVLKNKELNKISKYSEDIKKLTTEIQNEINDQAQDLCKFL